MDKISHIYATLLESFGPQGWWPLMSHLGTNPTKSGSVNGYHPDNYVLPQTNNEVFEICLGAILTQNTSWTSVEKALSNLSALNALNSDSIQKISDVQLKAAIRPAGYFNQKAKKIIAFAKFFGSLNGRIPSRDELLNIWGVGNETADSMLLYAFKVPTFVIDAYTKRIFSRLGLCDADVFYEALQQMFYNSLENKFELFNEYHALIVELAKRNCTKSNPKCDSCPITRLCKKCF